MKICTVVSKGICEQCKRLKSTVNGLCDVCTIKQYGKSFPWTDNIPKNKETTQEESKV